MIGRPIDFPATGATPRTDPFHEAVPCDAVGHGVPFSTDDEPGNPCHPLAATAHPPAVAFQTRIGRNGRGQPKETVDALTSCEGGSHADSKPHVAYAGGVRRLTPRECERLQGFPDDWTLIPYRNKAVDLCSDGPRYKAIGNSMAVPVMRWIGKRLLLVDGGDA